MTETQLQAAILKALASLGVWSFRIGAADITTGKRRIRGAPKGTPDICLPALGWLEVKLPGKTLSPDQQAWHHRARRVGARVAVVTSVAEAVEIVQGWKP